MHMRMHGACTYSWCTHRCGGGAGGVCGRRVWGVQTRDTPCMCSMHITPSLRTVHPQPTRRVLSACGIWAPRHPRHPRRYAHQPCTCTAHVHRLWSSICTTHAHQVRLTAQLAATLLCSRSDGAGSGSCRGQDGGGGGGGEQHEAALLPIPLGGAADAVLLARHAAAQGGALPLLVSPALWAMRAVSPSRLPETIAEQECSLDACGVP